MSGRITEQEDGGRALSTDELPAHRASGEDIKLSASAIAAAPGAWNHQTDDYEIVTSDIGKWIAMDKGTAVVLTVPEEDSNFDILEADVAICIPILNEGAGQVSVIGGTSNVFIDHNADFSPALAGQGSLAVLVRRGENYWYLGGDLEAAA